MTVDLIIESQGGNAEATLALIKKFDPLLKKHAYYLNYDDAYEDLLLEFLILLKNMNPENLREHGEGAVITYVQKSIYHSFINESKKIQKLRGISLYSDLDEDEQYCTEAKYSSCDTYFGLELHSVSKPLPSLKL